MPPDRRVETKVARVATYFTGRHPGFGAFGALIFFVVVGMVGMLMLFAQAREARITQCQRVNVLQVKLARILITSEASIPAEHYTAAVKDQFTSALKDLAVERCDGSARTVATIDFPVRPDRPPAAPAPPPSAGAVPIPCTILEITECAP